MIRDWFRRRREKDASWVRCPRCAEILDAAVVAERSRVCPACAFHHPLPLPERLALLCDEGSFEVRDADLPDVDPLRWKGDRRYRDELASARKGASVDEAVRAGAARLEGRAVELAVAEPAFLGGSLGAVATERLCRAFDRAGSAGRPLVLVAAGGGPRYQEGLFGQAALPRFGDQRAALYGAAVPFVAVLVPPLPAGALLSLATSADVVLCEPVPDAPGAPGADALVAAGLVDAIVPRAGLRAHVGRVLALLGPARAATPQER